MRRMVVVALGVVLLVVAGAGAVAWAGPGRGDPVKREAAKACIEAAKADNPGAHRSALREAVTPCLEAAGITPRELTPEQQARRQALRECVKSARETSPDAATSESDRPALREAVEACLAEAGITPGEGRGRLRQCIADAKAKIPDADRAALKPIVRECMSRGD